MKNGVSLMPRHAARFGAVADLLRQKNPAEGFARAAEIILDKFEVMSREMGAAVALKLCIDLHKHALFCEVAADKTRTQHDVAAYAAYQQYLAGTSDVPVATGINNTHAAAAAAAPNVDDMEEEDDAQEDDQ